MGKELVKVLVERDLGIKNYSIYLQQDYLQENSLLLREQLN
jgi:L-rhamnose mutarotase